MRISGSCSVLATRNISAPPGQDSSPWQWLHHAPLLLRIKFASTHQYTWDERVTVRVIKVSYQEHNTTTLPVVEPWPLDAESSALTFRLLHLPQNYTSMYN